MLVHVQHCFVSMKELVHGQTIEGGQLIQGDRCERGVAVLQIAIGRGAQAKYRCHFLLMQVPAFTELLEAQAYLFLVDVRSVQTASIADAGSGFGISEYLRW